MTTSEQAKFTQLITEWRSIEDRLAKWTGKMDIEVCMLRGCRSEVEAILAECEQNAPITVWEFDNAPKEYRDLSTNGGDEDWIAFVPTHLKDAWIPWLEEGPFGCAGVQERPVDGGAIRIGSHA